MHLNNSKPDTFVRTYCSLSASPWLQCLISSRQEILWRAGKTDHCESVREAKWVWASMSVLYICHDPSPISPQVLAFFFFFIPCATCHCPFVPPKLLHGSVLCPPSHLPTLLAPTMPESHTHTSQIYSSGLSCCQCPARFSPNAIAGTNSLADIS